MMVFNDLLDLLNKEKRKKERVKVAQEIAVGMGVAAVAAAAGIATGIMIAPKPEFKTPEDIEKAEV